ncbi:VOC family protein [Pelagicoccus enzymogenes]|uniref:VOC family protein n=1 Tax=Pelagicoccus enzymogenes TaxID=2773457 RepID=UPI00281008A4|nr:VOC family protein [Pelagicoccus enzymogenes]MDQ8198664.1 VOC family protein [Pelagicoccus enzymogenes]
MKITLTSIPVNDQEQAIAFYTEKLGFVKKEDIAMGEHRWLTVTAPEGASGVELLLEPLAFPPAQEYYKALYEAGIPAAQFETDELDREVEKMKTLGVVFRGEPQEMDEVRYVIFEDSCGNLICLTQKGS